MEFQSKWPITEWNSNLATSSQSFSLSNNCTTKYHIIHAHAHMHKGFVWKNTNYFLKFYLNRAKVNKPLPMGRVWINHPLIINLFYWKPINSWTYSKIISVTKAIFPQRRPSICLTVVVCLIFIFIQNKANQFNLHCNSLSAAYPSVPLSNLPPLNNKLIIFYKHYIYINYYAYFLSQKPFLRRHLFTPFIQV